MAAEADLNLDGGRKAEGVPDTVTIVGGGIGGLAMANALKRVGIGFDLYEQAPELTEVGAGIGLSKGALDLLEVVGLGEQVRAKGTPVQQVILADKHLNVRRKLPTEYGGICIHRADLIDILSSQLPRERIHLSAKVTDVRSHPGQAEIVFDNGTTRSSACVIAADGIHSVARSRLFPEIEVRYINQTIWRGITRMEVPEFLLNSYIEIWDEGLRFLTVPIGESIFWLAVKPAPPGGRDDPATVKDELMAIFKHFHPVLKELIRNTDSVLRNDMADLGTDYRTWNHNRIVFLGDSIHATTPNLAQGGCQAIEDAVCLALCLSTADTDLNAAFETYQRLRQKKVSFVVDTPWKFGKAAHSRNPLVHYLYRAILEHAPAPLLVKQERFLSDLTYLRAVDTFGMIEPSPAYQGATHASASH
jgi:2-polyprenyl-6-methoxyphenol hydroxylase-like FAD-dependent oxidoreductase